MAITWKKYEGGAATLEDLGTVKALAGKKGKVSFIPKNFKNDKKRVAVVVEKADGTSVVLSCSEQVSIALRGKKMNIKQLLGLSVLENEEGVAYISMPATGGALHTIDVDKVAVEAYEPETTEFLPEELLAL